MSDGLFRKQATQAFYSTDARGGVLTIAPPWSLVVFGAMTALLVALALLAALGKTQIYAQGRGVVRPNQPPIVLRAPMTGVVLAVDAAPGAHGHAGDPVLAFDVRAQAAAQAQCATKLAAEQQEADRLQQRLAAWGDGGARDAALALVLIAEERAARQKVTATKDACDQLARTVDKSRVAFPVDAAVDDVAVAAGALAHEGDALATLVPASARLVAYVGVPEAHRDDLVVGKAVRLTFDALPFDAVGAGAGTITRLLDALPSGVKLDAGDAPMAYAEVAIDRMPGGARARPGMKLTADVHVRTARVWSVLFGEGEGGGADQTAR